MLKRLLKRIFLNRVLFFILLFISFILLFLYSYIYTNFNNITIDQLIYSLNNAEGTSTAVIFDGAIYVFSFIFFVILVYIFFYFISKKYRIKTYLKIRIRNKNIKLLIFPLRRKIQQCFAWLFFCVMIIFLFFAMNFASYLFPDNSTFFEENYIDAKKINITAPDERKNLIYIYVESLESSFVSKKNGGALKKSAIPNLETYALENINFSQNRKIGGADMAYGASWTSAGMVAQSTGIPLKVPISNSNGYSNYDEFLPGAYGLGDVLKDNGYNNYLFLGSDANFGGRADYYKYHGNYEIFDHSYFINRKWIDADYYVWWGVEDKKLFKYTKKIISEKISDENEPFSLVLLTANTHFADGYIDKGCEKPFSEHYLNSYFCSDSEIANFIDWVKKQEFYNNTVIVIAGDHLTMQSNVLEMFNGVDSKKYERTIYNVFINSNINITNSKNRLFNSFDLYPTTLAALGFEIEGDRLGLGTNLFSSKKTLSEERGFKYINRELEKNSEFYNKNILRDSYRKMLLDKKKKA